MKPVGKRLIYKEIVREDTTESGIIIGSKVDQSSFDIMGEVISVGPKVEQVKVGDHILTNKMSSANFTHKGVSYSVINEDGVMVVFND